MEITIKKLISSSDWEKIEIFKHRFKIYWNNLKDLKIGVISGNFTKNEDGSYSGKLNLPNAYRLKGLYVDFRCFYMKREITNFHKFRSFIANKVNHPSYYEFSKKLKSQWKCEFIENGWFKFGGEKIKTEKLLELWFYGYMFHSDVEKHKELMKLLEVFQEDTALSMLFMGVYDMGLAVKNLHWSISGLRYDNLKVKIPASLVP